jgi:hypothetical protein
VTDDSALGKVDALLQEAEKVLQENINPLTYRIQGLWRPFYINRFKVTVRNLSETLIAVPKLVSRGGGLGSSMMFILIQSPNHPHQPISAGTQIRPYHPALPRGKIALCSACQAFGRR